MTPKDDLICVEALKTRLRQNEDIFLLDVRSQAERDSGHMGGVWIPLDELSGRLNELPKGQEIVVYCRSGQRSQTAVDFLRVSGFSEAKNLMGGILAWSAD